MKKEVSMMLTGGMEPSCWTTIPLKGGGNWKIGPEATELLLASVELWGL